MIEMSIPVFWKLNLLIKRYGWYTYSYFCLCYINSFTEIYFRIKNPCLKNTHTPGSFIECFGDQSLFKSSLAILYYHLQVTIDFPSLITNYNFLLPIRIIFRIFKITCACGLFFLFLSSIQLHGYTTICLNINGGWQLNLFPFWVANKLPWILRFHLTSDIS